MTARVVIIGIGNPWRGDDGVGWAVAGATGRRLGPGVAIVESDGEPGRLLDAWTGRDLAVVVDAVRSGAAPGMLHVWAGEPEPARGPSRAGSHALGLAEATALGRALDRLPTRMIVIGVEARDTDLGHGLSPAVAAAVEDAVDAIERIVVASRTVEPASP